MEENKKIETVDNVDVVVQNEEENSFDIRTIFTMVILNWQWFVLSLLIFIFGAFIYLRYKTPVYSVSCKMLIKDEDNRRRSNQMLANMKDLGFMSNSAGIENEVEILKSKILAEEAVRNLKIYTDYYSDGRVKKNFMYLTQPVSVDIDPLSLSKMDDTLRTVKMTITKESKRYLVQGVVLSPNGGERDFETSFTSLPAARKISVGTLTFTANEGKKPLMDGERIHVVINPVTVVANRFVNNLTVEPTSKLTQIALITVKDINPKRAEDYVTELCMCYNGQANADKNEIARKTEQFINDRMDKINHELGMTESQLESYKRSHNVTNMSIDAGNAVQRSGEFSDQLSQVNAQIQMIDYMREYVDNPSNKYQIMPSGVGLSDASSAALINDYNKAVQDRNRLLRSASENAPQVMTLTSTLDELQRSIRTSLTQAHRSADIRRQSISSQYSMYQGRVSSTPAQERVLTEIGRQQEVKSGLYLMLLQKREENSIELAATADKGKVIDKPKFGGKVSPNSIMILLLALILGAGLPALVLYLLQFLKYKIEGPDDIAKITKLPLVAEVAVASESAKTAAGIVVHENQNDQIDEIFRSMRTNIQFMMTDKQKVILFSSTTSGEGKTFNAANLAVSFALLGKKVILLGLDIRKPALGRLFNVGSRDVGITNLLNKENVTMADVNAQVIPSGVNKNLDLLLAGPVPPNPAELLARENLNTIFNYLKEEYDYLILDTAPVGLVTDTYQIAKYADVSVMICRSDYTPKANVAMLNTISNEKKMPNMCVVLNGVDMSKKKYRYYYGYGRYGKYGRYGYGRMGYGKYGYGNYGSYGNYASSHYGKADDKSIKK